MADIKPAAAPAVAIKGPKPYFKTPEGRYELTAELWPPTGRLSYASQRNTQVSLHVAQDTTPPSNADLRAIRQRIPIYVAFNSAEYIVMQQLRRKGAEFQPPYLLGEDQKAPAKDPKSSISKEEKAKDKEKGVLHLRFRERPLCHDLNTARNELSLIAGFLSGDMLMHVVGTKDSKTETVQFNKNNCIIKSKVTAIRWVTTSRTRFVAAFASGHLLIMDTSKTDPPHDIDLRPITVGNVWRPPTDLHNPVAAWSVSKLAIHDLAFSADGKLLAMACQDGYVRVFNFEGPSLLYSLRSYFGAFRCVAWTMDGKYLITGGEDDFVTVYSTVDPRVVCRGVGHSSWVASIAVDPWASHAQTYRFASAGEDGLLLLWDLNVDTLRRPRKMSRAALFENPQAPTTSATVVSAPGRAEVPLLHPIVVHRAHVEPLSAVAFLDEVMVTSCGGGTVKVWSRPEGSITRLSKAVDPPKP